jgi:ubiquinone/menaquinone biosynthesis C-methylase UbiE
MKNLKETKKYAVDGRDEIKKFYASPFLVKTYEELRFHHPIWNLTHQREVSIANRFLIRNKPKKILDLALGTGRVLRALKGYSFGVGVDINKEMLRNSQASFMGRSHRNVRRNLVMADAFHLPFLGSSFDAIIAFRFVRHFRQRDRKDLFSEVKRVLNPGGVFIFEALNASMGDFAVQKAGLNQFRIYDELWSEETLHKEVEEAGFQLHTLFPIMNQFRFLWLLYQGFQKLRLSFFSPIILRFFDQFSSNHPYEWGVVCKKI